MKPAKFRNAKASTGANVGSEVDVLPTISVAPTELAAIAREQITK